LSAKAPICRPFDFAGAATVCFGEYGAALNRTVKVRFGPQVSPSEGKMGQMPRRIRGLLGAHCSHPFSICLSTAARLVFVPESNKQAV
jgi:hypothetical protein